MTYHIEIIKKENGKLIHISADDIEKLSTEAAGITIDRPGLKSAVLDLRIDLSSGGTLFLTLQRGRLWTDQCDREVIEKMIEIANKIGARVRGDDFETYRTVGKTYLHPDDVQEKEYANEEGMRVLRESKRQSSKMAFFIVMIFVSLAVVAYFLGRLFER